MKALLLILDGLGDYVHPKYKKTPLMAAKKKYLKIMEKQAETGLMQPLMPGLPVGSDTGHLALFGYDPLKFYFGRGPFEALGSGFQLKENDVAFRLNFATAEDGKVVDRRAGRNAYGLDELAKALNFETKEAKFIVQHTTEHRGFLVIRPKRIKLGTKITDFDFEPGESLKYPKRLNNAAENKRTELLLKEFIKHAIKVLKDHPINVEREKKGLLKANIVLLRGAGKFIKLPTIEERFGIKMACVAGGALYKGVAKAVGMDVLNVPGATGDKNTNLNSKALYAVKASKDHDIVFMHVKATDNFGHDGNFEGKKWMIERVDKVLGFLMQYFDIIVITGDHSTPVTVKHHTGDPVPILLWAKPELGITRPDHGGFHELTKGNLRLNALDVLRYIRNKMLLVKKFGE